MKAPSKYQSETSPPINTSLILESIADAIIITNSEGEIQQVNKQTEIMFGYSTEELIGQKIENLLPERYQHKHVNLRSNYFADPTQRFMGMGLDLFAKCKDNSEFPCEISLNPLNVADELYVICCLRNMSEHKRLQNRHEEDEQFMMEILDFLPQIIAIIDETGNILAANKAWHQFAIENNYAGSDFTIGSNYLEICDTVYNECVAGERNVPDYIRDVLSGKVDQVRFEYARHSPDEQHWFQCRINRLLYNNQKRIVLVHEDITEIKREHESLLASEQRLRKYFDLGLVGMAITSPEKKWLEFNDTLCNMLGYSRDEIGSKTWVELTHPDDLEADMTEFNRVLAGETDGYVIEKRFIHKNSSILYSEISVNAIRKADGSIDYFLALVHDLTEKKQAEKEASEQRERLAHLIRVQTLGEMATGIAHEINQPLAAIECYAQACQKHLQIGKPNPDKVEELLEKISGQAKRAGMVVSRLRTMMQHRTVNPINININKLLLEVEKTAEINTKHHDCRLILNLDPVMPIVIGDDVQIQQVVLNMVLNGIDAMEDLNYKIEKVITIETKRRESNDVLISISDKGKGISEEDIDSVFEAFYTTKGDGLGMGLTICKSIIDAHGGEIGCSKAMTGGTTMYFTLPVLTQND